MARSLSKEASRPSLGRHAPKVKSACRTCKLRKVKCDEGRPACNRCITAGRTCEGYGIWGGGNARPSDAPSALPLRAVGPTSRANVPRKPAKTQPKPKFVDSNSLIDPQLRLRSITPLNDYGHAAHDMSDLDIDIVELLPEAEEEQLQAYSIPRVLMSIPQDPQERLLLSWYLDVTSWKLPGTFSSEFWNTLLPQACHSEPAVLHGVLALASAHRSESLQPTASQALVEEQWTLRAYTKAIRHLQSLLQAGSARSTQVAIITCILFVCLEIVRRRYSTAASHLSSGLKLIKQSNDFRGEQDDQATELIEQAMLKLSLQVNQMGHQVTASLLSKRQMVTKIPKVFHSVEEARDHLDKLEGRILEMYKLIGRYGVQLEDKSELDEQREAIREDLRTWLKAYAASAIESNPALPDRSKAATIVLRMYYQTAVIFTEVCQQPRLDILYDDHTSRFLCIANDATKMWNAVRNAHYDPGPQFPGDISASIIDIGWIPATYFLALKCRVREIRLRAIHLLERTYHTEGMWNALMCAQVAREIMNMEEGPDMYDVVEDDFSLHVPLRTEDLSTPTVPESQRLYDVEMIHPEEDDGRLKLKCRRRNSDGLRQYTSRSFDPAAQRWDDTIWYTVNPGCDLQSGNSMVLRPESWIAEYCERPRDWILGTSRGPGRCT